MTWLTEISIQSVRPYVHFWCVPGVLSAITIYEAWYHWKLGDFDQLYGGPELQWQHRVISVINNIFECCSTWTWICQIYWASVRLQQCFRFRPFAFNSLSALCNWAWCEHRRSVPTRRYASLVRALLAPPWAVSLHGMVSPWPFFADGRRWQSASTLSTRIPATSQSVNYHPCFLQPPAQRRPWKMSALSFTVCQSRLPKSFWDPWRIW